MHKLPTGKTFWVGKATGKLELIEVLLDEGGGTISDHGELPALWDIKGETPTDKTVDQLEIPDEGIFVSQTPRGLLILEADRRDRTRALDLLDRQTRARAGLDLPAVSTADFLKPEPMPEIPDQEQAQRTFEVNMKEAEEARVTKWAKSGHPWTMLLHPCVKQRNHWQVTALGSKQEPQGDWIFKTKQEAVMSISGLSMPERRIPIGDPEWKVIEKVV